jgi:hypothetical protein
VVVDQTALNVHLNHIAMDEVHNIKPESIGPFEDDNFRKYKSSAPKLNKTGNYIEYFSCNSTDCPGSANYNHTTKFFTLRKDHTCDIVGGPMASIDVNVAMKNRVEYLALTRPTDTASMVWNTVHGEFYGKPGVVTFGLTEAKSNKIYFKAREKPFENIFQRLEAEPLVSCGTEDHPDPLPFLQFNVTVNNNQKLEKIIGLGHHSLIRKARQKLGDWFIDGTFAVAPKGFKQCLIVMVFDTDTELYTPVWYVLTQSKNELTYKTILQLCITSSEGHFLPGSVTADFEKALQAAVLLIFVGVTFIVGCLFHWKQAIRRHMIKVCKIDEKHVRRMMKVGKLDILTTIPVDDIVKKGIPYLRSKFAVAEAECPAQWKKFWEYFINTWMKGYDPISWNISGHLAAGVELRNRTNNGLERYNRRLGSKFTNHQPPLEQFVTVVKKEAHSYIKKGNDIRARLSAAPTRHRVVPPRLPRDYAAFQADADQVAEALLALSEPITAPTADVEEVEDDDESDSEDLIATATAMLGARGEMVHEAWSDDEEYDRNDSDSEAEIPDNRESSHSSQIQVGLSGSGDRNLLGPPGDDSEGELDFRSLQQRPRSQALDSSVEEDLGIFVSDKRPRLTHHPAFDALTQAVARHHHNSEEEDQSPFDSVTGAFLRPGQERPTPQSRQAAADREAALEEARLQARIADIKARMVVSETRKEKLKVTAELKRQLSGWREVYDKNRVPLFGKDYSNDHGPAGDLWRLEPWTPRNTWIHERHGRLPTKKELGRKPGPGTVDFGHLSTLTDVSWPYNNWCSRAAELHDTFRTWRSFHSDLGNDLGIQ